MLTAATKLGLPRLQVQALNGLALTYSTQVRPAVYERMHRIDPLGRVDPYFDYVKAARFAAQSIAIANQAEYRYGRAHAGFYMGIIYAAAGLGEVATNALQFSERLFDRLEHSAGLDFCREAKARYHLTWESPMSSRAHRPRARRAMGPRGETRWGRKAASSRSSREAAASTTESGTGGKTSQQLRIDVCWLDFWGGSPSGLNTLLLEAGFRPTEQIGGLEVWRSNELPDIVLEVLNVDSFLQEPVSKLPGVTAQQVDNDRRRCCVPRGMDPYYRCAIYAADPTSLTDDLHEQLSDARSLLNSCFVDIASFPGAQLGGDWMAWEKTTVSMG